MIDDDRLRRRYGELPVEEPPEGLDRSILEAAHRAVAPRHAAQRWAVPVSLAAVLVLAVGVTLRMQQETPGIEVSAPANEYTVPPSPPEPSPGPDVTPGADDKLAGAGRPNSPAVAAPPRSAASAKPPAAHDSREATRDSAASTPALVEKKVAPAAERFEESSSAPTPRLQAIVPSGKVEAAAEAGANAQAPVRAAAGTAATRSPQPAAPATVAAPPVAQARAKRDAQEERSDLAKESAKGPLERELERIAQLRRDGRHAEADAALEKFRRENPSYRIPDATWEQVKPRY